LADEQSVRLIRRKKLKTANSSLRSEEPTTYNYTGGLQTYTVTVTGVYDLTAFGAQGDALTTTLSVSNGTITAGGQTGVTVTLSCTASQINAALAAAEISHTI
jgi:hypothetical protein